MTIERIVLTGFMGAGKSTVGRLLAQALAWPFADLDDMIVAQAGVPVPRIFAEHGEAHFRSLEHAAALQAFRRAPLVLALGGGALESDSVFHLLRQADNTLVVFLDAPLPELLRRCQSNGGAGARPLLAAPSLLHSRLALRLPRYRSAHLTIETGALTPEEIVAHIHRAAGLGPQAAESASPCRTSH